MIDSFAFSEVVRKLANIIRIGKIAEIKDNLVKVKIGRVTTNWLPVISTAGETSAWSPISVGEQVAVFCPYGEFVQAFVLRSIHYDNFKTPEDKNAVSLKTNSDIKIESDKKFAANTKKGFEFSSGKISFKISDDAIDISSGNAHINMSGDRIALSNQNSCLEISSSGIQLNCGSSSIDISGGNISLSSGSISTTPPICKCSGGM